MEPYQDIYSKLAMALWMQSKNPDFGFGKREVGDQNKGLGFLGMIPNGGGYSTEVSAYDSAAQGEYPLLIPSLSPEELASVIIGNPLPSVYEKAAQHAEMRKTTGQSPFASPMESLLRKHP